MILSALCQPGLGYEVIRRLQNGQSTERVSEWLDGVSASTTLPGDPPRGQGTGNSHELAVPNLVAVEEDLLDHSILGTPRLLWRPISQSKTVDHDKREKGQTPAAGTHPEISASKTRHLREETASASACHYRGLDRVLSTLNTEEVEHSCGTWTTITNDMYLVRHLLALYFCWEYPTFASLSKEHFLRDFHSGRHIYCSSILVNALLALGCRFSDHPATKSNPEDSTSTGDHFFRESQRLLDEETDHHSLTTIQALGIMAILEASFGRDAESLYYAGQSIRLAFEMGLHNAPEHGNDDALAVQSATFWGAFALDQ